MSRKYVKKTKRETYDWERIETDYVTDPTMTYDKLSQQYGPTPKAISHQAREGNWKVKRLAFQEKKRIKAHEVLARRKAKEEADEISRMNKSHYDSQQGLKYLSDRKIVSDVDKVKSGQKGELSIKEIQSLSNANKTIQESQRVAKGLGDKELNINLVTQQLAPFIEKIVEIIQKHVPPETTETLLLEFRNLFGDDVP